MPTYDYRCQNCDYKFESFHSIKKDPMTICPNCQNDSLKRLIGSGGGLIFKGPGFYCNDYKADGPSKKTE